MPKDAYPYDTDLQNLLASTGIDVPETLLYTFQDNIDAAIAEWEDRTGWGPYLAPRYPVTVAAPNQDLAGQPMPSIRLFDPGGRYLPLRTGLLSLTSLAVGVTPNAQGTYAPGGSGTILTQNLDFFLRPQNALEKGLAFTEVEFRSPMRGVPQSIAINGVWGRVLQIPDSVWKAILQKAALECLPELGINVSNGLVKIDDVQFLTSGGNSPLLSAAAQWGTNFNRQIGLKKRVTA